MYWLRRCPRCSGDLYEGRDIHAGYVACIQCGYYLSSEQEEILRVLAPLLERAAPRPAANVPLKVMVG